MAYSTPAFLRKALLGSTVLTFAVLAAPLANAAPAALTKASSMKAQETILVAEKMQPPRRANQRENRGNRNANGQRSRNDRASTQRNNREDRGANRRENREDRQTNRRDNREDRNANRRDRRQNHAEHRRDRRADNQQNHRSRSRRHSSSRSYGHTRHHNSYYRPNYSRRASHGYRTPYRSNLGISFHFGTPGYSQHRWAPSAYSFYRPSYGHYNSYQSRTTCRRINIEGWHHGHREVVSVKQCSNPWDGTYIVQGSERVIACRW